MSPWKGCIWRSWKVQRFLLLSSFLVGVSSFCFTPCQRCEPPEDCQYGVVDDTCNCCKVCGAGPGDDCGEEIAFCGRGLECYKEYPDYDLSPLQRSQWPGQCRFSPNTTSSTSRASSPSTSAQATAVTMASQSIAPTSEPIATGQSATLPSDPSRVATSVLTTAASTTTTTTGSANCRYPVCSVEYCNSSRHRICSAQGFAHTKVAGRGECQHTSCRACFLYVKPNCTTRCQELPTKQCLKRYYKCVRNSMLASGVNASSVILPLIHQNIGSRSGRIICYVPEVVTRP